MINLKVLSTAAAMALLLPMIVPSLSASQARRATEPVVAVLEPAAVAAQLSAVVVA